MHSSRMSSDTPSASLRETKSKSIFRHIVKLFMSFFPPYKSHQNIFSGSVSQNIEDQIVSLETRVVFTRHKHTGQKICLKAWLRHDDELCNAEDERFFEYLLDGFDFNRKFAPGVYLGI